MNAGCIMVRQLKKTYRITQNYLLSIIFDILKLPIILVYIKIEMFGDTAVLQLFKTKFLHEINKQIIGCMT